MVPDSLTMHPRFFLRAAYFGDALYSSNDAAKAEWHCRGGNVLLVCRVAIGHFLVIGNNMHVPPKQLNAKTVLPRFDSACVHGINRESFVCIGTASTTQPHNHTTTQPHNHTTTQPHNNTTTQPHNTTPRRRSVSVIFVPLDVVTRLAHPARQLFSQTVAVDFWWWPHAVPGPCGFSHALTLSHSHAPTLARVRALSHVFISFSLSLPI